VAVGLHGVAEVLGILQNDALIFDFRVACPSLEQQNSKTNMPENKPKDAGRLGGRPKSHRLEARGEQQRIWGRKQTPRSEGNHQMGQRAHLRVPLTPIHCFRSRQSSYPRFQARLGVTSSLRTTSTVKLELTFGAAKPIWESNLLIDTRGLRPTTEP